MVVIELMVVWRVILGMKSWIWVMHVEIMTVIPVHVSVIHMSRMDGNYSVFAGGGEDGFGLDHDHEVAG